MDPFPEYAIEALQDRVCEVGITQGDVTCEFCGKTYAADEENSVSYGYLDGRRYVWGCRCPMFLRYVSFLWTHRFVIQAWMDGVSRALIEEGKRMASSKISE